MAVGGGRVTARLQIGHSRQGRTKQGRGGRALQRDVRRDDRARREKKKARRWVRAVGRGRVVARQGDHQTGQTPVEGNDRAASALEGGGVAGTRRRNRVVTRGSQEPSGGTTAGTQRRRRDHARCKFGAR